ncbi:MAG: EF-hand domain-containing protein, partial [Pirellulaceae bacterium]|nr:EF-hand domain-containing protein [Pirellulaceae bacterium]
MNRSAKVTGRALKDRNSDAIEAATGDGVSPSGGVAANVFQRYDRNGDGKVTPEELPNKPTFEW